MPVSGLTASGPRSLLRQIREVMASDAPAQGRLDEVVRSIARAHGGDVSLRTRERGGLTARVSLPL